jgi:hypothetical protein
MTAVSSSTAPRSSEKPSIDCCGAAAMCVVDATWRHVVLRGGGIVSHLQQFYGTAQEPDFGALGGQLCNRFNQRLYGDIDDDPAEGREQHQADKDQNGRSGGDRG